jgi:hypothetical protein
MTHDAWRFTSLEAYYAEFEDEEDLLASEGRGKVPVSDTLTGDLSGRAEDLPGKVSRART